MLIWRYGAPARLLQCHRHNNNIKCCTRPLSSIHTPVHNRRGHGIEPHPRVCHGVAALQQLLIPTPLPSLTVSTLFCSAIYRTQSAYVSINGQPPPHASYAKNVQKSCIPSNSRFWLYFCTFLSLVHCLILFPTFAAMHLYMHISDRMN